VHALERGFSMEKMQRHVPTIASAIVAIGFAGPLGNVAGTAPPPPAAGCPVLGWREGLVRFLAPDSPFPTEDTKALPTPDCNFHQWSWEAFVWATALITNPATGATAPRFMTLATPGRLLDTSENAGEPGLRPLTLAARSETFHGMAGFTEGAGSIVEADGNMLVPERLSSLRLSSYEQVIFRYSAQKSDLQWRIPKRAARFFLQQGGCRLQGDLAPARFRTAAACRAYTTQAQVPVLDTTVIPGRVTIQPLTPPKYVTVTVALVGLHVVGFTENHPEFLWGTFEHNMNSPATPDGSFTPSPTRNDPMSYTLYKGGTPFSQVNNSTDPPRLRLDPVRQKLTPITNVVLENQTGGENQMNGVGNIFAVNMQG
jgi:hypothetical protein